MLNSGNKKPDKI